MIDVVMVAFTATATVLVTVTPLAILGAVGAARRRRLIAKVDATTATLNRATAKVEEALERLA